MVQIVKTDWTRNLFRRLIFCPQRFIWINTALFCLWQQNSQGLEEILRGEDCSTCEKTEQGQWKIPVQPFCFGSFLFILPLSLDTFDKRRNLTFSSPYHINRVARGQNLTLFFFFSIQLQLFSDLAAADEVSASSTSIHVIYCASVSHLQATASAAFPLRSCSASYLPPLRLVPEGTSWDGGERH